jgi:hypothetical protein
MVGARRINICKFFSAILAIYSAFYKAPYSSLCNLSVVCFGPGGGVRLCSESNPNPMGIWLVSLCPKSVFVCFVLKVEACDCLAIGLIDRKQIEPKERYFFTFEACEWRSHHT